MPAVGDLDRVRQRLCRGFAIAPAAVAGNDHHRGMLGEPGLRGRWLSIGQQSNDPTPFQVADDAGVPMIAPPCPIINADNLERVSWRTVTASDHAQERILADRQHQPLCEACCRSTAKRQTEVMDDSVEPCRASCRWCQYAFSEAFREDLTPAQDRIAAKAPPKHKKFTCRDCEKISQPPAPFHATPRGFIGPQLLATILFDKFGVHIPLNRQSARFKAERIALPLSTLADQVRHGTFAVMPLFQLIERHVLAAERLHGDDTTIRILAEGQVRDRANLDLCAG